MSPRLQPISLRAVGSSLTSQRSQKVVELTPRPSPPEAKSGEVPNGTFLASQEHEDATRHGETKQPIHLLIEPPAARFHMTKTCDLPLVHRDYFHQQTVRWLTIKSVILFHAHIDDQPKCKIEIHVRSTELNPD